MWKKVLISVVAWIAALLVLIVVQPSEMAVERSMRVEAPPEMAYALVADFKEWPKWLPWEKLDLNMKKTLSGSASGEGGIYAWEGNDEVGSGRMQITEAKSPEQIVIAFSFSFLKPFQAENITTFPVSRRRNQHCGDLADDGAQQLQEQGLFALHGHGQDDWR